MNALIAIEKLGAPSDSYIGAIRFFNDRADFTKLEYETHIADIMELSVPINFETRLLAKYHFLYLVQEAVRTAKTGSIVNEILWSTVQNNITKLAEKYPHILVENLETEEKIEAKPKVKPKPKPKKETKRSIAIRIYEEFVEGKDYKRKEAAAIIAKEGNMSVNTAGAYLSTILKKKRG